MSKVFHQCPNRQNCSNATRGDAVFQCKSCGRRYCIHCVSSGRCEACGKAPSFLSLASQFREIGRIR